MAGRVREWALVAAATLLSLAAAEIAARIWITLRWPEGEVYSLTHRTEVRGRFAGDPWCGYGLSPGFRNERFGHNSRGFRGAEFSPKPAPGVVRIAIVGASTVYGAAVKDGETSSVRLQELLVQAGVPAEVINAGVPGWTTAETLRSLEHRVLPLKPDVVIL